MMHLFSLSISFALEALQITCKLSVTCHKHPKMAQTVPCLHSRCMHGHGHTRPTPCTLFAHEPQCKSPNLRSDIITVCTADSHHPTSTEPHDRCALDCLGLYQPLAPSCAHGEWRGDVLTMHVPRQGQQLGTHRSSTQKHTS